MEQEEQSNAQTWSPSRVHGYLGSGELLSAARDGTGDVSTLSHWGEVILKDLGAEARLQAGLRSAQGTLSGLWELI